MKWLDRLRGKKKTNEFRLDVSSKNDERMFTVRDIEITVQKTAPHLGIARVYLRGGTENERSSLANLFLSKLPTAKEMRYNFSVYHSTEHESSVVFRDPDTESLTGLPPAKSEQKPVIPFEVLCHAAESLERQYKGRILGES